MTRKARCGSTQKHTKMPADATPWEELSREIKTNVRSRRGPPENKTIKETVEKNDPVEKMNDEVSTKIEKTENEPSTSIEKTGYEVLIKIEAPGNEPSINTNATGNESLIEVEAAGSKSSTETENGNHSRGLVNQETNYRNQDSFKDNVNYKKKVFWEKLKERRHENGVTLLSPKQERKIYLIKKKLRQKGMPPEVIRDIIRKKRRAEEIQYRKTVTTKICFNCREKGHLLSECPQRLGSTNQVTGICFKCGSTEHVSYRCLKKVDGYPLAKCFICKEQGHISKECPKNKRGVYIKGGSCNVCGNINHLQKDCPTLRKKKEEHIVPAYTINEGISIDAEIMEDATGPRKKMRKQPKVVKF